MFKFENKSISSHTSESLHIFTFKEGKITVEFLLLTFNDFLSH